MASTKMATKAAERAAYTAHVKSVIEEAHAAAKQAFIKYAETAKRTKDGFLADSCGGAGVIVYKPSYRLRKALQELNEISPGYKGAWSVSHFSKCVTEQGITAHEVACNVALNVIEHNFPEEGKFYMKSYID